MRVIVTGGTGLIGSRLAASLAADNHEVIVLSRNPERHTFPVNVTGARWDGRSPDGWGHLVNATDAIVNLAGESIAGTGFFPSRWTRKRKWRILTSRVNAGEAIAAALEAAETRPRVLIQASAVGYYGPRGDEMITETAEPGDDFLAQVCLSWEGSTAVVEPMGVRRVVIRSGMVLSLTGGALPITVLPFRFFVGGPLGNGRQYWPWIHIEDEIRAIRFLIENDSADGVFNLCAPNPLTNRDFARELGRVMERPSFLRVPAFILRLALGEASTIVLDGQRALPQRLQELGFAFVYPDANSALADFF